MGKKKKAAREAEKAQTKKVVQSLATEIADLKVRVARVEVRNNAVPTTS